MAGQVVDAGACRAGGVALLRVDVAFGPIGENVKAKQRHAALAPSKDRACAVYSVAADGHGSKKFLSPVAGQVVDVGASLAGGLTRRRVDV